MRVGRLEGGPAARTRWALARRTLQVGVGACEVRLWSSQMYECRAGPVLMGRPYSLLLLLKLLLLLHAGQLG